MVALICCSINTETKQAPAKKTVGALFIETRMLGYVSEGLLFHSEHSEGKLSKTKEFVHGTES